MWSKIKNLYCASGSLKGEWWLRPLKWYRRIFVKNNLYIRMMHYLTGVLCYPLFGGIASIGLFLNWIDIMFKNQEVVRMLDQIVLKILEAKVVKHRNFEFTCQEHHCWSQNKHCHPNHEAFHITKKNVQKIHREIEQKIDELTKCSVLCCYQCEGTTAGSGKLIFTLEY